MFQKLQTKKYKEEVKRQLTENNRYVDNIIGHKLKSNMLNAVVKLKLKQNLIQQVGLEEVEYKVNLKQNLVLNRDPQRVIHIPQFNSKITGNASEQEDEDEDKKPNNFFTLQTDLTVRQNQYSSRQSLASGA